MPTNINFVEKLDAGCDTQVSFNLPKTLSLGTVKKSFDNNGLSEAEGCSYLALNKLNQVGLLNKASLVINPSSFSENALYADVPANSTLGDFAFTRATDAWRTNSQGLVQRTPWNLLQYSEQFDNAAWSKSRASVLPNTAISPDGDLTATTLIEDTNNATHRVFQSLSKSSTPIQYTFSCYLKAKERTFAQIKIAENGEADSASAVINLSTGQLTGTYGTYSNVSGSVVSLNNGWYRLSITATSVNASSIIGFILPALNGNLASPSYLGNGTSGIYIWGAQLTEGSSALEYFPTTDRQNVPRIDYSLGGCPNILLEPQRTNLVLRSEEFESTSWVYTNSIITANSSISPSGIQNADTFAGNGLLTIHDILQTGVSTITAGITYTASIYAKKNTNNFIQITGTSGSYGINVFANFNLNSGTVGTVGSSATATITNVGNGWYRCTMTATATGTSTTNTFILALVSSETSVRGESNTLSTSVFIWGAQLEAGAYSTSYIPTTSASVTRNADSITRNNIFTNGLITAAGGTWFVELNNNVPYVREASGSAIWLGDTSNGGTNAFVLRNDTTSARRLRISKNVSAVQSPLFLTTTDIVKFAIKWNGTTADVFVNGVKVVSATSFAITNMQFLGGSGAHVPMFIKQMALFPTPLTDAECLALTT